MRLETTSYYHLFSGNKRCGLSSSLKKCFESSNSLKISLRSPEVNFFRKIEKVQKGLFSLKVDQLGFTIIFGLFIHWFFLSLETNTVILLQHIQFFSYNYDFNMFVPDNIKKCF